MKKKIFLRYLLSSNRNYQNYVIKKKYKPKSFLVFDYKVFKKIKKKFKNNKVKIINKLGENKLIKKNDITISTIPGIAGLEPTINLIKKVKKS